MGQRALCAVRQQLTTNGPARECRPPNAEGAVIYVLIAAGIVVAWAVLWWASRPY
jgi:hypothetical protein